MATIWPAIKDLARFGSERVVPPAMRSIDGTERLLKNGAVVRQVYLQMAEPRWAWRWGPAPLPAVCFDVVFCVAGIDQVVPVDVLCPVVHPDLKPSRWIPENSKRNW